MKQKSAIMQMFYGERGNFEFIKHSSEYFDLLGEVGDLYDKIQQKLEDLPEVLELFKKYEEKEGELECQAIDDYFLEGFRFGTLMGIDISTVPENKN